MNTETITKKDDSPIYRMGEKRKMSQEEIAKLKDMISKRYGKLLDRAWEPVYEGGLDMDEHYEYLTLEQLLDLWKQGKIPEEMFPEVENAFYFPSQEASINGEVCTCCGLLDKVIEKLNNYQREQKLPKMNLKNILRVLLWKSLMNL